MKDLKTCERCKEAESAALERLEWWSMESMDSFWTRAESRSGQGQSQAQGQGAISMKVPKITVLVTLVFYINCRVSQKTGLFLSLDNFAKTNDRKACNTSKVSDFCLE